MTVLKKENSWTTEYFPNFSQPIKIPEINRKKRFGALVEFLFKYKIGDYVDLYLMKFTYNKWEKKFKHFDANKFELTMRTNRGISKHHPRDFQTKVIKKYTARIKQLGIEE